MVVHTQDFKREIRCETYYCKMNSKDAVKVRQYIRVDPERISRVQLLIQHIQKKLLRAKTNIIYLYQTNFSHCIAIGYWKTSFVGYVYEGDEA